MIKVELNKKDRVYQGDIFSNINFIEYAVEKDGLFEISNIRFPLVIVLTQDCDLAQDYSNRSNVEASNQDKHLFSVLVAPLYNVEHIYTGEHLSNLGLQMQTINKKSSKTDNRYLKNNKNPRFHFLKFENDLNIVDSVIDFKHYFTVNIKQLMLQKEKNYIGKVGELYREDISQRFSSFLSRIGLPD